jgi:hypothetical protein
VKVTALFMLVITSWLVITAHSHLGLRAGLVSLAARGCVAVNQDVESAVVIYPRRQPEHDPGTVARPPQEGTSRPKGRSTTGKRSGGGGESPAGGG